MDTPLFLWVSISLATVFEASIICSLGACLGDVSGNVKCLGTVGMIPPHPVQMAAAGSGIDLMQGRRRVGENDAAPQHANGNNQSVESCIRHCGFQWAAAHPQLGAILVGHKARPIFELETDLSMKMVRFSRRRRRVHHRVAMPR